MQIWSVSHGANGYRVEVMRVRGWAQFIESCLEPIPCFHPKHEWLFKIGFGRDGKGDGYIKYSLGEALMRLCEARHVGWRFEERTGSIPIDADMARVLEPAFVEEMEHLHDDDEPAPGLHTGDVDENQRLHDDDERELLMESLEQRGEYTVRRPSEPEPRTEDIEVIPSGIETTS